MSRSVNHNICLVGINHDRQLNKYARVWKVTLNSEIGSKPAGSGNIHPRNCRDTFSVVEGGANTRSIVSSFSNYVNQATGRKIVVTS